MKCEDCLPLLETGSRFGQWRARRHIACCSRCAAEVATWNDIKTSMQTVEPLTFVQKSSWLHGAESPDVETVVTISTSDPGQTSRRPRRFAMAAVCAVCLVLCVSAIGLWQRGQQGPAPQLGQGNSEPQPDEVVPKPETTSPTTTVTKTVVIAIKLSDELEQLDTEILASLQEIERLKQHLERLEVRQSIGKLLAQYSQ